ncbi:MAG TPA: diaminopimelate epimerase, partial [Dermatophilaceae bacterium]|nr:diaminopimelate epimerase [Dermatophilaceae bacterium]
DFVVLSDPDGSFDPSPAEVRFLCDRRAGVGADGVLRAVPARFIEGWAGKPELWFMDYRNADGSVAQMCGNGTRVFAAYLTREGLEAGPDFAIATRAGLKHVRTTATGYAVNLGPWRLEDPEQAAAEGFTAVVSAAGAPDLPGLRIDLGNPHTVVVLPPEIDLADLDLPVAPAVAPTPPEGTNVEFVRAVGPGHLAMRVHERGVGETRSCGTGAVAAALAVRWWEGSAHDTRVWTVDVPGGRLTVTVEADETVELAGPAALVADGVFTD